VTLAERKEAGLTIGREKFTRQVLRRDGEGIVEWTVAESREWYKLAYQKKKGWKVNLGLGGVLG